MKTRFVLGIAAAGLICLGMGAAPQLVAALPSPAGLSTGVETVAPLATPVKKWNKGRYMGKNWNHKNWNGRRYRGPRLAYVRGWYRCPYYGRIVAGVHSEPSLPRPSLRRRQPTSFAGIGPMLLRIAAIGTTATNQRPARLETVAFSQARAPASSQ